MESKKNLLKSKRSRYLDMHAFDKLVGMHALLAPSNYSWVNYDEDKLLSVYRNHKNAEIGTKLHALASELISMKVGLPRTNRTLNKYVNDCIGYHLDTEIVLYYSEYCFGTADAIGFEDDLLRIFDLKTGSIPASEIQLLIYASLFCLQNSVDPEKIKYDLRLYQTDNVIKIDVVVADVVKIMEKIVAFSRLLDTQRGIE